MRASMDERAAIDERSLVQRIVTGDRDAYAELVRAHQARILRVCTALLGDPMLAEDAAQETFLKAYQSLASFRGQSAFGTWLYRIAANRCLDLLRKRQREHTESWDALVEESGGVLLPKGRLQVEPTISYSHLSSNRVGLSGFSVFDVIFIGEIRSDEINRDIVTSSVNTRYGVTNNLEVELDVPTQFQYEEVLSGPIENREQSIQSRGGLNDISAAMFYQFVREHGAMPSLIANMKLRAPTGQAPKLGSGTWGVKGGLTMVKTSDPVALFSNVGYSLNLPGTVNGVSIDPGDSFEYSAGLAYALNYHLAVNGGFEQIFISQSKAGGGLIKGSRLVISNLKAGINYALTKKLSLDFSVGAGLTEDSPDVTVTFSLPYTF